MTTAIPEFIRTGILKNPKQLAFLLLNDREGFYGGAAGGGKTVALLAAALQYVDQPGYRALIVRRTYQSLWLAGTVGQRAMEFLNGTQARWNGGLKLWTFPSGAILQFGHLQTETDARRYLSAEYQFIGFDELTEIGRDNYEQLLTRLRRPAGSGVPLRARSASNPGGPGHDWVRERFIMRPTPGRVFIPATILDNPGLDRESYIESLKGLPQALRDRYLHGDWDALDDGLLSLDDMLAVTVEPTKTLRSMESLKREVKGPRRIGVDVGRKRDLTVIWLWEKVGEVYWTRAMRPISKMPLRDQYHAIKEYLSLPALEGCWIDKGAIGYQLAEDLEADFPAICHGVGLSESVQGQLAVKLASLVKGGHVRLPDKEEIRQDWRLIRMPNTDGGQARLTTNRDESGHGDRFWAAALALFGATFADRLPATPASPTSFVPRLGSFVPKLPKIGGYHG